MSEDSDNLNTRNAWIVLAAMAWFVSSTPSLAYYLISLSSFSPRLPFHLGFFFQKSLHYSLCIVGMVGIFLPGVRHTQKTYLEALRLFSRLDRTDVKKVISEQKAHLLTSLSEEERGTQSVANLVSMHSYVSSDHSSMTSCRCAGWHRTVFFPAVVSLIFALLFLGLMG